MKIEEMIWILENCSWRLYLSPDGKFYWYSLSDYTLSSGASTIEEIVIVQQLNDAQIETTYNSRLF